MAEPKLFKFDTLALHAGQQPDPTTGARAVPIYQTTSYVFDDADQAAALFNLERAGQLYSRISNPTVAVFEERMAALEDGRAALGCATGQSAEATAILTLCKAGDHVVSASTLYGGTHTLLGVNLKKLGIDTTFVNPDAPENFRQALKPNTKLLYAETLGNPLINIVDIAAVAAIAKDAGVPLVVVPERPTVTDDANLTDATLRPPRLERESLPPVVQERLDRFKTEARAYLARQQELKKKLEGANDKERAAIREQLKVIQQEWLERAKEMRKEYKDRQAELAEKLKEYRELLDSVRSTTLRDAGGRTRRGDD
jgi:hypothetical protein